MNEVEQLKLENDELKKEVERLKTENANLRRQLPVPVTPPRYVPDEPVYGDDYDPYER